MTETAEWGKLFNHPLWEQTLTEKWIREITLTLSYDEYK